METTLPLRARLRARAADAASSRAERTVAGALDERSGHVLTVAALAAFLAAFGDVGSDALWFVPLGANVAHGHVPGSIPYATASTAGWHDVPALGELVFWALYHAFGGVRGLVVAQTTAVAVAFGALARGLRHETSSTGVLVVSAVVLAGALPAVVVTEAGLFSLALFAILLALLEAESRSPGGRIWWSVPLIALWGNLHGGVLAGLALLGCYVVFARARRRPVESLAVLAAAILAPAANPTLWHTPRYYSDVLHGEVVRRAEGLWAPLGLGVFDALSIVAALTLVGMAVARGNRIRLWEAVALVGLAAATVHVARNGVSLLFVAAYPAARLLRLRTPDARILTGATAILAGAALVSLVHGPVTEGAMQPARHAAETGRPVLADAYLGQQVVLAGGRVWVENPIDAFGRKDQRLYLDWLAGRPSGDAAVGHAAYVLVQPSSRAGVRAAVDPRLVLVEKSHGAALYRIKGVRSGILGRG